jgi:hypothetical protein
MAKMSQLYHEWKPTQPNVLCQGQEGDPWRTVRWTPHRHFERDRTSYEQRILERETSCAVS